MFRKTLAWNREMKEIEQVLQAILEPVKPDETFKSRLKNKLLESSLARGKKPRMFARVGAIVLVGSVAGIMVVILGVRLTTTILAALGIVKYTREHLPARQEALVKIQVS